MMLTAKPGTDWNRVDLSMLRVNIEDWKATEFFGQHLKPVSIDHLDPALLLPIKCPIDGSNVNKDTYRFLMNLHLALYSNGEASNEVLTKVLEMMGYDVDKTILRRHHGLSFTMCGKVIQSVPDICLYHTSGMILLVVRHLVEKMGVADQAPIVADAVAAFEHNNEQRFRCGRGLPSLDTMVIPCITMTRLRTSFYKISITQELSDAVTFGQKPEKPTNATCCVLRIHKKRGMVGMEDPEYRQIAFQYFDAFLESSKECWAQLMDGL